MVRSRISFGYIRQFADESQFLSKDQKSHKTWTTRKTFTFRCLSSSWKKAAIQDNEKWCDNRLMLKKFLFNYITGWYWNN